MRSATRPSTFNSPSLMMATRSQTVSTSPNSRVEAQQFLSTQELVVIRQLGQVTDSATGNRLAHVDAEEEGRAAGRVDKTQQHVHGGSFSGSIRTEKAEYLASANAQVEVLD